MDKFDQIIEEQKPGYKTAKYFSVLPSEILFDNSLNMNEKFIVSEIVTMTHYAREFHASNEYLASMMNLKKNSVSRIISDLHNRGYFERIGFYCPKNKKTWKRVLRPLVHTECKVFTFNSTEMGSHLFRESTFFGDQ